MRFRFVDRILDLTEEAILTEKAVSFEELGLLKPWGRKGALPETLLLQVAVESAAHLVAHRSGGTRTGVLAEAEAIRFEGVAGPGAVLQCQVLGGEPCTFTIRSAGNLLASGRLRLRELPLADCHDLEAFTLMRSALHAPPRS